jgi:serine/threonine-protein kinase
MIGGLEKGRVLGDFVVEDKLASGGMGEIYRATQTSLERPAVIKILRLQGQGGGPVEHDRFLQEAKLASKLDHPYAAHVYAFGAENDGLLWIAMEFVPGVPLDHMIKQRGGLPAELVDPLVEKIAEVLDAAHQRGIIHRDLKPANVMVVGEGGTIFPKLLDFGIAKLAGAKPEKLMARTINLRDLIADELDTVRGRLTDSSVEIFGSPRYMPPEQWASPADVGPAADMYSLGVLVYEALAGRPPFTGETFDQLRRAHETKPVPPIAGVPAGIQKAIARALAKKPEDRYPDAMELARDLRAALDAGGSASVETTPAPALAPVAASPLPPAPTSPRRIPVAAVAAGAVVVLAGAIALPVGLRIRRARAAAPAPELSSLRQLTHAGACVYSPVFLDAHTIVADVTRHDATDLWKIDAATGELAQELTSDPGMEYRAAPGPRPGTVVYVDAPREGDGDSTLTVLDVADGKREPLAIASHSAWYEGGALVYSEVDSWGLRVRQGDADDVLADSDTRVMALAASATVIAYSSVGMRQSS